MYKYPLIIANGLISLIVSVCVLYFYSNNLDSFEFGLVQLYITYTAFSGLFSIGFSDGIFLTGLNKKSGKLVTIFYKVVSIYSILQFVAYIFISLFLTYCLGDNTFTILLLICLNLTILMNLKSCRLQLTLLTQQYYTYTAINILEKLVMVLTLLLFQNYYKLSIEAYVCSEAISKLIGYLFTLLVLREKLIKDTILKLRTKLRIFSLLCFNGIFYTLSSLSNSWSIPLLKIFILKLTSIEIFAKYSLLVSISGVFTIFISFAKSILLSSLNSGPCVESKKVSYLYASEYLIATVLLLPVIYELYKVIVLNYFLGYIVSKESFILLAICIILDICHGLFHTMLINSLGKSKLLLFVNTLMISTMCLTYLLYEILMPIKLEYYLYITTLLFVLRNVYLTFVLQEILKINTRALIIKLTSLLTFISGVRVLLKT